MSMKGGPNAGRFRRDTKSLTRRASASVVFLLLALCGSPALLAQARRSNTVRGRAFTAPSAARIEQHVTRAKAQVLSATDVNTFQGNLQNLVNWLAQAPTTNPNQALQVSDLQNQINSMTSDEMTSLANDTDVAEFNTAVSTITSTQPTTRTLPPSDPPANLVNPPYGICAPTNGPPAVPSDAGVDKALLITIEALTAAKIVADDLQNLNIEIAGEENNLPFVIVAIVADEIVFALQTASDEIQFCDPYDEAAEVYAGWQNTIVIDTDLANLTSGATSQFTQLANQLTASNTDIDNHIASIASTSVNQFPQINTQLTSFSTNVANQEKVMDIDIDSHIAAADIDLNNRLSSVDADLKNASTAIATDMGNQAGVVDSDVLSRDTKIDGEISTLQTLQLRLEIEHALTGGLSIGIFELPSSQGGYLETLRAIVSDAISKLLTAGQNVGTATKNLALGDTAYTAKQYKAAYYDYMTAYQTAVH